MQKTTIYLDNQELTQLKVLAANKPHTNVAKLIRQAIKSFLKQDQPRKKHAYLKKNLRQSGYKNSFGDPVLYQRNMRKEWH